MKENSLKSEKQTESSSDDRRQADRREGDRRSGQDRRNHDDQAPVKVERRKRAEPRKPEMEEVELTESQWAENFGLHSLRDKG